MNTLSYIESKIKPLRDITVYSYSQKNGILLKKFISREEFHSEPLKDKYYPAHTHKKALFYVSFLCIDAFYQMFENTEIACEIEVMEEDFQEAVKETDNAIEEVVSFLNKISTVDKVVPVELDIEAIREKESQDSYLYYAVYTDDINVITKMANMFKLVSCKETIYQIFNHVCINHDRLEKILKRKGFE